MQCLTINFAVDMIEKKKRFVVQGRRGVDLDVEHTCVFVSEGGF